VPPDKRAARIRPGTDDGAGGHHIAQLNVGRLPAAIDAPASAGFADALDEVDALAERSPGFVWRL
jgi:hypothetical protein